MRLPNLPLQMACGVARLAGWLSRRLGKGGGTTFPGVVLQRLRPNAIAELTGGLSGGVILVSGTNGKTTTSRLLRSALDASGASVVANTAGSNLERGIAAALLSAGDAEVALFEVDEAALPAVAAQVKPRVLVLLNLFRDHLDRFGELEQIVEKWKSVVANLGSDTTLIYNADDPAVAAIAAVHPKVVSFGITLQSPPPMHPTGEKLAMASEGTNCRRCDAVLSYRLVTIGHQGHWACGVCGFSRATPTLSATNIDLQGARSQTFTIEVEGAPLHPPTPRFDGQQPQEFTPEVEEGQQTTTESDGETGRTRIEISLGLPGLTNTYNAVAAMAAALEVGLDSGYSAAAFARRGAAFGRGEKIQVGHHTLTTLLTKNPVGAKENIALLASESEPLNLLLLQNERSAVGQSLSWIWDVDYRPLLAPERLGHLTISGTAADELALRLRYAGAVPGQMKIEPDIATALDIALQAADGSNGANIYVLHCYPSMLAFRAVLASRDLVGEFWEDK